DHGEHNRKAQHRYRAVLDREDPAALPPIANRHDEQRSTGHLSSINARGLPCGSGFTSKPVTRSRGGRGEKLSASPRLRVKPAVSLEDQHKLPYAPCPA